MPRLTILALLAVGLLGAALVFGLDPSVDINVAALFYRDNHFVGQTPLGEVARRLFYWIPSGILLVFLGLYAARRLGRLVWAPTGRGLLFLVVTFLIGPGLLANVILKDHSHRPRPYQTREFGGDDTFRPFYRFDGACRRNCSFVSGEGATSAWTIAAAILTPPPVRLGAIVTSVVFAACSGLLRMAFGGHYLSDTIFAALFVWTVLWIGWHLIRPKAAGSRAGLTAHRMSAG